jgi:hypothetical protein
MLACLAPRRSQKRVPYCLDVLGWSDGLFPCLFHTASSPECVCPRNNQFPTRNTSSGVNIEVCTECSLHGDDRATVRKVSLYSKCVLFLRPTHSQYWSGREIKLPDPPVRMRRSTPSNRQTLLPGAKFKSANYAAARCVSSYSSYSLLNNASCQSDTNYWCLRRT